MFKPNTLVSYKGGGYDGCWWEWNYAYIGRDGVFHNIFSSGRKGCDTLDKLQRAYQDRPNDFDFYLFDEKDERLRFARCEPISRLLGVARSLYKIDPSIELQARCDECGELFDAREMCGEDPHGIGGIMQEYRKLLCPTHADEFDAEYDPDECEV